MAQCKYKKHDDSICNEKSLSTSEEGYCIFHEKLENKDSGECTKQFYEKIRDGETDFEGFILKDVNLEKEGIKNLGGKDKIINFRNSVFSGVINFHNIKFSGDANFSNAKFSGDADFSYAKFSGHVNFINAKFSGYTNFVVAKFSGYTDFINAKFSEGSLFVNAKFSGDADFSYAKFSGHVGFMYAEFSGNANFKIAKFSGDANFEKAKFSEVAYFRDVKFSEEILFTHSTFEKVANFYISSFEKKGSFKGSTLNIVRFNDSELRHVVFDDVDLTKTMFHGAILDDSYISNAKFRKKVLGEKDQFMVLWEEKEARYGWKRCKKCNNLIIFPLRYILYMQDFLFDKIPRCIKNKKLMKGVKYFFQDYLNFPLIKPGKCEFCGAHLTEKDIVENKDYKNRDLMFKKAEETYRKLKLSIQNEGEYELAGDFYYREMKMRRKRKLHEENFGYWLLSHLYSKICGYGEKPWRVILNWFMIVLLYGFVYHNFEALYEVSTDFDYYYFSVVTFTTLGFGDLTPDPSLLLGKVAAMSEAVLGAFMMALFVLVFGRKMLR